MRKQLLLIDDPATAQAHGKRAKRDDAFPQEFVPRVGWCPYAGGIMFLGPERPSEPMGIGPYTGETFIFRGYVLRRRNVWRELVQQWDSHTSISVVGPGVDWVSDWRPDGWRARVAGVTADGSSMQEALDEAWAAAESEDQLRHLAPAEGP